LNGRYFIKSPLNEEGVIIEILKGLKQRGESPGLQPRAFWKGG